MTGVEEDKINLVKNDDTHFTIIYVSRLGNHRIRLNREKLDDLYSQIINEFYGSYVKKCVKDHKKANTSDYNYCGNCGVKLV